MLAKGGQTPFETKIIVFCTFILHEMLVLFVDRVVRQVHVLVVLVELGCVRLRRKSRQSFFIDVYSQGFVASYDNIDSQVKFVAVN